MSSFNFECIEPSRIVQNGDNKIIESTLGGLEHNPNNDINGEYYLFGIRLNKKIFSILTKAYRVKSENDFFIAYFHVNDNKSEINISKEDLPKIEKNINIIFVYEENDFLIYKTEYFYKLKDSIIEKKYTLNGELHRDDGPAVEESDGTKKWYIGGELHRLDGPAVVDSDGNKFWYKNGKHHRLDGPAVEMKCGIKEWHINGERLTEKEFNNQFQIIDKEDFENKVWSMLNTYEDYKNCIEKHGKNGILKWRDLSVELKDEKIYFMRLFLNTEGKEIDLTEVDKYYKKKIHCTDGPAIIYKNGDKEWYVNGKLHRIDGPAVEENNGTKKWYFNGKLHRENGPAIIYNFGRKEWYIKGELHRVNGPAVEENNGTKKWYFNGILHRDDGPAVEESDGTKKWYIDGECNRIDIPLNKEDDNTKGSSQNDKELNEDEFSKNIMHGRTNSKQDHCDIEPTIEYINGHKEWRKNGKLHRLDGPAVVFSKQHYYTTGEKIEDLYYIDGIKFHNKDLYEKAIEDGLILMDDYEEIIKKY